MKKTNSGFKYYVLSDREAAFICQVLNIYYNSGDKREGVMIERIIKILNGGEE